MQHAAGPAPPKLPSAGSVAPASSAEGHDDRPPSGHASDEELLEDRLAEVAEIFLYFCHLLTLWSR